MSGRVEPGQDETRRRLRRRGVSAQVGKSPTLSSVSMAGNPFGALSCGSRQDKEKAVEEKEASERGKNEDEEERRRPRPEKITLAQRAARFFSRSVVTSRSGAGQPIPLMPCSSQSGSARDAHPKNKSTRPTEIDEHLRK